MQDPFDLVKQKAKDKWKSIDKNKIGMAGAGLIGAGGLGAEIAANRMSKVAKSENAQESIRMAGKLAGTGAATSLVSAGVLAGLAAHRYLKNRKKYQDESENANYTREALQQ